MLSSSSSTSSAAAAATVVTIEEKDEEAAAAECALCAGALPPQDLPQDPSQQHQQQQHQQQQQQHQQQQQRPACPNVLPCGHSHYCVSLRDFEARRDDRVSCPLCYQVFAVVRGKAVDIELDYDVDFVEEKHDRALLTGPLFDRRSLADQWCCDCEAPPAPAAACRLRGHDRTWACIAANRLAERFQKLQERRGASLAKLQRHCRALRDEMRSTERQVEEKEEQLKRKLAEQEEAKRERREEEERQLKRRKKAEEDENLGENVVPKKKPKLEEEEHLEKKPRLEEDEEEQRLEKKLRLENVERLEEKDHLEKRLTLEKMERLEVKEHLERKPRLEENDPAGENHPLEGEGDEAPLESGSTTDEGLENEVRPTWTADEQHEDVELGELGALRRSWVESGAAFDAAYLRVARSLEEHHEALLQLWDAGREASQRQDVVALQWLVHVARAHLATVEEMWHVFVRDPRNTATVDSLPDELLLHVLGFVRHAPTLLDGVPLVCRRWSRVAREPACWRGAALRWWSMADYCSTLGPPMLARVALHAPRLGCLNLSAIGLDWMERALARNRGLVVRELVLQAHVWRAVSAETATLLLDLMWRSRRKLRTLNFFGRLPSLDHRDSEGRHVLQVIGQLHRLERLELQVPDSTPYSGEFASAALPGLRCLNLSRNCYGKPPPPIAMVSDLIRGAAGTLHTLVLDSHTAPCRPVPLECLALCGRLQQLSASTACLPALPSLKALSTLRLFVGVNASLRAEQAARGLDDALRHLDALPALKSLRLDLEEVDDVSLGGGDAEDQQEDDDHEEGDEEEAEEEEENDAAVEEDAVAGEGKEGEEESEEEEEESPEDACRRLCKEWKCRHPQVTVRLCTWTCFGLGDLIE